MILRWLIMKLHSIDKILTLFYRIHFKHGFIKTIKYTITMFYSPEKYIVLNGNPFKKFTYRIVSFILGTIFTIVVMPIYLAIYLLTAILTFIPVIVLTAGIGLYYGLMPFLLKLDYKYNDEQKNAKIKRSGLDTLLIPLTWGGIATRAFINSIYQVGLNPPRRIKELQKKENTYIIMSLGLGLASIISYVLYSLALFAIFELTSFFTLSIVALISLIIWTVLVLFIRVIGGLFSDKEFETKGKDPILKDE